jgi:hypothetical protein
VTARAHLEPAPNGITELVDLGPTTVHLVHRAANGFGALAAKAEHGRSPLAKACRKAGIELPRKRRRTPARVEVER